MSCSWAEDLVEGKLMWCAEFIKDSVSCLLADGELILLQLDTWNLTRLYLTLNQRSYAQMYLKIFVHKYFRTIYDNNK